MSRFNTKTRGNRTTNLAGGEAFKQSPKMELVSILLTSFVKDQFYESADDNLERLSSLLRQVDPKFAAKAAIYTRHTIGMRSISHALAGELAPHASGTDWGRAFYEKVVRRPDDMMEILAYYYGVGNKRISSAMQWGFRRAFKKFDAYQLAKWRGDNKEISLVDVVRLVHPSKDSPNIEAIGKLINGNLKSERTWESKMTKAGQNASSEEDLAEKKSETWAEMVMSGDIGYFALLRNLRNIMEDASENVLDKALEMLVDRNRIKNSLVMPFRYVTALSQIDITNKRGRKVADAVKKAFEISLDNLPELYNTVVVVDNSGSMHRGYYGENNKHFGSLTHGQLGALFGMMFAKKSNADIVEFGNTARYIGYDSSTHPFDFANNFRRMNQVGHGTDFSSIFDTLRERYDRVVIFSDMQGWIGYHNPMSSVEGYKKMYNADPHIYCFDLSGYGSLQFVGNKIYEIGGFSEKVFDLMGRLEEDPNVLINEIEGVKL